MKPPTVFERNPSLKQPPGRAGWAQRFAPVLDDLRATIRTRAPQQTAACSGATWNEEDGFTLDLIGQPCTLSWPDLVVRPAVRPAGSPEPLAADAQGLLLYYLATADGTPPAGRWISFRELPDGWLYHQAFQGYSGDVLARALGNDLEAFGRAASRLGGARLDFGDSAWAIRCLPRLTLAVLCWLGDDEFGPRAQVLFDAAAAHYLPTDGLAVLGSLLVRRLLRAL